MKKKCAIILLFVLFSNILLSGCSKTPLPAPSTKVTTTKVKETTEPTSSPKELAEDITNGIVSLSPENLTAEMLRTLLTSQIPEQLAMLDFKNGYNPYAKTERPLKDALDFLFSENLENYEPGFFCNALKPMLTLTENDPLYDLVRMLYQQDLQRIFTKALYEENFSPYALLFGEAYRAAHSDIAEKIRLETVDYWFGYEYFFRVIQISELAGFEKGFSRAILLNINLDMGSNNDYEPFFVALSGLSHTPDEFRVLIDGLLEGLEALENQEKYDFLRFSLEKQSYIFNTPELSHHAIACSEHNVAILDDRMLYMTDWWLHNKIKNESLIECIRSYEPNAHLAFATLSQSEISRYIADGGSFYPTNSQPNHFIVLRGNSDVREGYNEKPEYKEGESRSYIRASMANSWVSCLTNETEKGTLIPAFDPNTASISIEIRNHYTSAGFYQVNNGSRTVEVFHSYVTYTARNIQTGAIIAEVTLENKAPSSLSSNAQSKHYMPLPTPYHADNKPKISEFLRTILQG